MEPKRKRSLSAPPLWAPWQRRPIVFSFHTILLLLRSLILTRTSVGAAKSVPWSIIVAIFSPPLKGGTEEEGEALLAGPREDDCASIFGASSSVRLLLLLSHCVCVLCVSKCLITG